MMLKLSLWYFCDAHILDNGTVSIANITGTGTAANNGNKK